MASCSAANQIGLQYSEGAVMAVQVEVQQVLGGLLDTPECFSTTFNIVGWYSSP